MGKILREDRAHYKSSQLHRNQWPQILSQPFKMPGIFGYCLTDVGVAFEDWHFKKHSLYAKV